MIRRLLLSFALLSLPALAQLQVLLFDGTTETPVGAVVDMGSAAPSDSVETRFRVRNFGTGTVALTALKISDPTTPFRISASPSLPVQLAPGSAADFRVAFTPPATGTFNGLVVVNTINIALRGFGVPSATLTIVGNSTAIATGSPIDFGSIVRGSSKLQTFALTNQGKAGLTVTALAVAGTGFRGPLGAVAPIPLAPGQSIQFQIAFEPGASQKFSGTLTVDQRSFSLTGLGLDPPLPTASIAFSSQSVASAQQNIISIPLAAPSAVSGSGTLTMEFHPSVAGVADDAAVRFVTGAKRNATVNVSVGDTFGKFGSQSTISFQTGTTAGTIVFTLTMPNGTQQTSLNVTPQPISLDTVTGVRRVNALDVSMSGFDNTYSASQLSFTFYDSKGATMQPGVIRVDASSDFRLYFANTQVGGAFALLASFPTTGDSTLVAAVDVQIVNAAGITKSQRITF